MNRPVLFFYFIVMLCSFNILAQNNNTTDLRKNNTSITNDKFKSTEKSHVKSNSRVGSRKVTAKAASKGAQGGGYSTEGEEDSNENYSTDGEEDSNETYYSEGDENSNKVTFNSDGYTKSIMWPFVVFFFWVMIIWVVGFCLLYLIGKLLSALTLRSIESADPNIPVNKSEWILRKIYSVIINISGAYYYLSLPIVTIIIASIIIGTVYMLLENHMPFMLAWVILLSGSATITLMWNSLFNRFKKPEPGRPLTHEEAPGLWELTLKVASDLKTRSIDEIRITPDNEFSVYERGKWLERYRNKAKLILVIGTANLVNFKVSDFCAVLAHEYGHFSNRDTAGGRIAFRVCADLFKFYSALAEAGHAHKFNIAMYFLRVYDFIFRRISFGASRLQEILADRVAAQTYGAQSFSNGLTHIIKNGLEFELNTNRIIPQVVETNNKLPNLYKYFSGRNKLEIDPELDEALNRTTSPDDTHPSPQERIRLISKIEGDVIQEDPRIVLDLFTDKEALTTEMTMIIDDQMRENFPVLIIH